MRSALVLSLLALLGGCHLLVDPPRFGADDGGDSSVDADARAGDSRVDGRGDGADDAGDDSVSACKTGAGAWVFGSVELRSDLSSADNDAEYFELADGLTAYLGSQREGPWRIYMATRSARGAPFDTVTRLAGVDDANASETHLSQSADGTSAFLSTDRAGGSGGPDIWLGSRASTAQPWALSMFTPLSAINTSAPQYDPWPSADGLRVYYASGSPLALYVAERASTSATFGAGAALGALNSDVGDHPALTADERVIIFGSSRPGGAGDKDLWYATRASGSDSFSAPQPLPTINTPALEGEAFLGPDGCELYFSSDRAGGLGGMDIYRVQVLERP